MWVEKDLTRRYIDKHETEGADVSIHNYNSINYKQPTMDGVTVEIPLRDRYSQQEVGMVVNKPYRDDNSVPTFSPNEDTGILYNFA